jgi:hypothetical protein
MGKLKSLITEWPKGAVLTSSYLREKGISRQLIDRYKASKWIDSVGRGAYKLDNERIEWTGGLYALQKQLGIPVHVGGKTALELRGYAHYLQHTQRKCFLFGVLGQRLPKWFMEYKWNVKILYRTTSLFPPDINKGISVYDNKEFVVEVSTPERAVMEMLYLLPNEHGFDECYHIMESMTTLRTNLVQELLELCHSIKVKRMFLFMAEKHEHAWFTQLSLDRIYLGKGKRVIVKNGVLDTKYQITIPHEIST